MTIRILAATMAVASTIATGAFAQEPVRLAKADVETLVVGKEIKYARGADGNIVQWDIRKDGSIYYTPTKSQRAMTIGGSYTIEDDGAFCTKWRDDKYIRLTDGCYYFVKNGDKTSLTGRRNPERVIGDLVE